MTMTTATLLACAQDGVVDEPGPGRPTSAAGLHRRIYGADPRRVQRVPGGFDGAGRAAAPRGAVHVAHCRVVQGLRRVCAAGRVARHDLPSSPAACSSPGATAARAGEHADRGRTPAHRGGTSRRGVLRDVAPAQVWARLLHDGISLSSISTMYRLWRSSARTGNHDGSAPIPLYRPAFPGRFGSI